MSDEPLARTLMMHANNRTRLKRKTPDLRVAQHWAEGRHQPWIRA